MTRESPRRLFLVPLLAGLGLAFPGRTWPSGQEARPAEEARAVLSGLEVSFKLDPRLTRGLYLGDRWISPPTYTLHAPAAGAAVEARIRGVDATGKRVGLGARWTPGDPTLVTVVPADGADVTITVHRVGESRLSVSAGGLSRELIVRAAQTDPAFQVQIVQVPQVDAREAEQRTQLLGGVATKRSYALGIDTGRWLKQQPLEVDIDSLAQGLAHALEGRSLLTEQELRTALGAYYGRLQARRANQELMARSGDLAEKSRQRVARRNELAERNRTEGEAFLAENGTRQGVVTLASGLQYKVLQASEGPKPAPDATVVCRYRGTLIDGTEFDSSRGRRKPATFALKRVIRGWKEALQLMPVGSKWQLFIPPHLAYGVRGTRTIGPNATLVFEVELLSIDDEPG